MPIFPDKTNGRGKCPVRLAMLFALVLCAAFARPAEARGHHHHAARRLVAGHAHAAALVGTSPKFASFVIDAQTGAVYHQDDPDKLVHPASLTKMMTLAMVFNGLSQHRFTLHSRVPISAFAHSMAPSKLDIPIGSTISVENAIYAVVTHSSNDIAVALGEFIGGSSGNFSGLMNSQARAFGMNRSHFVNACGLHNPAQVTTARDMATLARVLIYRYPQYYHYFATPSFTYDGKVYANHNHLMETYAGMDGIKTGYIGPSGFNLVASVKRGNRRMIGVVFGGQSAHGRDMQMAAMLDAAFAQGAPPMAAQPVLISTNVVPDRKPLAPPVMIAANDAARPTQLARVALQQAAPASVEGEGDDDTDDSMPAAASAPLPGRIAAQMARAPAVPAPALQSASIAPAAGASIQVASAAPQPAPSTPVVQESQPDWGVQIGAYGDRIKTDQALHTALNSLPFPLRHATTEVAPLTTASGTIYRGRLNGFTQTEAAQACARIPNCLTISPDAGN